MRISLISSYEMENYGIRILSSCLKEAGHHVSLFFLRNFFLNDYEDRVLNQLIELTASTDLVGISLMTNNFDNAVQITKAYKSRTEIPIVWGGTHPTIRPEECLDYADFVCIGEAESSIVKLAGRIERGKTLDLSDIRGIGWKKNGTKVINGLGELVGDLDSLPFPDYSLDEHYTLIGNRIRRLDLDLFKHSQHKLYSGTYITFPTRGCPFSCTYCFNSTLNRMYGKRRRLRKRSPINIIQELEAVIERFSFINRISFSDDNFFMYGLEQIKNFSLLYKERVGLPLNIDGISPETVDKAKISCCIDAGLQELRLGIQSGSSRIRRMYNRNHSNQQIEDAIKTIYSFRDKLKRMNYDVIVDNPWETEEDTIETLRLLSRIPYPRHLIVYSLTFFPGTPLYERAKEEGIIRDDLEDVYRKFYHSIKNTYLNQLFFLLDDLCARRNLGWLIPLLTSKVARKVRPLWLVRLLRNPAILREFVERWSLLMAEGFKALLKGDWRRVWRYLRRRED